MGKSKARCTYCDRPFRRVLFLSLAILIFFWAAVYGFLPLSTSLWRLCSNQGDANCKEQTDVVTHSDLHPNLPLKLERSDTFQVPTKSLIDIGIQSHSDGHLAATASPAPVAGDDEDSILIMQNSIDHHHQKQHALTSEQIAEEEVVNLMNNLRIAKNRSSGIIFPMNFGPDCEGKRTFIYKLPSKFNVDLLNQCHKLIPWQNLCDYVSNSGMGKPIEGRPLELGLEKQVLVPSGLWYQTHQYALEIIFHERLKQYSCLVENPDLADMFYIPYYGGLDVLRWHFVENATNAQRDALGLELIGWLKEQPTWSKNKGADHALVLGKISWDFRRWPTGDGWGSTLLLHEEMQNLTKLLIERQPWHEHDVGVPHPTFFHPRHDRDIRTWQGHIDGAERRHLVSFAGQPRPQQTESIRSHLIKQCLESIGGPRLESTCYFLQCSGNACLQPNTTMNLFVHSEFCLQPPGDSPTRRSIFDSLIAGCIPVLFDPYSCYYQYPWHLPADSKSYSVYFPAKDVREGKVNVIDELRKIPKSVRHEMRLRIIYDIMPGLVYARPGARLRELEDAFLISMRSLFFKISSRLNRGDEIAIS